MIVSMIVFLCAVQVALVLGAVQWMDRAPWRQVASWVTLLAALLLPFYLPAGPLPRALMGALALLAVVKVLRVRQHPSRWSPRLRLWHALAPFDVERTHRVPPALDRALLAWTVIHAVIALGALVALSTFPRTLSFPLQLLRLLLGGAVVYAGMEALTEALRLLHRLAGIDVPALQDRPLLSTSIREFWGRRWNRPVSGWLAEFVFAPVTARSGTTEGLVATFVASGILHAWVFVAAVGWIAAMLAGLFFLFQGVFVLMESLVGIRRASLPLQRLWTLGLLALTSPLFVDPVLRVFGL